MCVVYNQFKWLAFVNYCHAAFNWGELRNESRKFFINECNGARNPVYLNGDLFDGRVELKPYDMIKMGNTRLLFVPLCVLRSLHEEQEMGMEARFASAGGSPLTLPFAKFCAALILVACAAAPLLILTGVPHAGKLILPLLCLMSASFLLFYLIGVPAFGLRDMLNRVFHARGDTFTPFRAAVLTVACNAAAQKRSLEVRLVL